MAHEKVLDARARAVLAQLGLLLEDLQHGLDHRISFVLGDECRNAHRDVRLGRETAADAQRVAHLVAAFDGGEGHVVDLRVGAPDGAAGNGDLELARQVVELWVGGEPVRYLDGERAGVDEFVAIQPCERATCNIAHHVTAGALGTEANSGERVHDLRQRLDGKPVQLNVLSGSDVGKVARVLFCQFADDAQLVRREQAVGQPDAHHKVLGGLAHAVLAASDARTVALGIDAPPLEVELCPLRQYGSATLAGKLAYLVPCLPGILGELQSLGLLGFALLDSRGSGGRRMNSEVGHMIPENSLRLSMNYSVRAGQTAFKCLTQ